MFNRSPQGPGLVQSPRSAYTFTRNGVCLSRHRLVSMSLYKLPALAGGR